MFLLSTTARQKENKTINIARFLLITEFCVQERGVIEHFMWHKIRMNNALFFMIEPHFNVKLRNLRNNFNKNAGGEVGL